MKLDFLPSASRDVWQVIDYLQKEAHKNNFDETQCFWHCIGDITSAHKNGHLMVAKNRKKVVGYLVWVETHKYICPPVQLKLFEVFSQYRRQGVGNQMLQMFRGHLKKVLEDNWITIFIRDVSDESKPFWEKMGFCVDSTSDFDFDSEDEDSDDQDEDSDSAPTLLMTRTA